jgi:hypothetical protein
LHPRQLAEYANSAIALQKPLALQQLIDAVTGALEPRVAV